MRIQFSRANGTVLMMTLIVIVLLGITAASVVTIASNQYQSDKRSEDWNAALAVAESGLEESLTHLNTYGITNIIAGIPKLDANGWTLSGAEYVKKRTLNTNAHFTVKITSSGDPIITSEGYYRSRGSGHFLMRKVQARTKFSGNWPRGLLAITNLWIKNTFIADSYDSSNPSYSTGGRYDLAKRKAGATVGICRGDFVVELGKADIYGRLLTGPRGSISYLKGGAVGSLSWVNAGYSGAEAGAFRNDFSLAIVYPQPPWSGGAFVPVNAGNTYHLTTGNWEMPELTMTKDKMFVTGDAVLYVKGDVSLGSGATINIAANASLRMYVGGASSTMSGSAVVNESGRPERLIYYGLKSNTLIKWTGNDSWCGVLYAPSATLECGGGAEMYGAFLTRSVKISGGANFHYDENLARLSPPKFVVSGWTEL